MHATAHLVCSHIQLQTAAKRVCTFSVQALQVLYSEREVGGEVDLPRHWMRDFFLASLCLEVQENQEALSRLQVWPYLAWPYLSLQLDGGGCTAHARQAAAALVGNLQQIC